MIRENGEFVIESVDGVSSWLIWIHFLVMLLLMIILVYLTVISVSDKSTYSSSSSPPSSSSFNVGQISANSKYNHNNSTTNCSSPEEDIKQVNENHQENQSKSTRRGIIRSGNPIAQVNGVEALSPPITTTTTMSTPYCSSYNPCYLLELGRRAFLKCLGLDDTPTTPQDSSLPNGNNGQGKLTKRDKSQ